MEKNSTAKKEVQSNIEFFEKGFVFTDIVPVSAKSVFGNNWKEQIISRGMDEIKIFNHAEKDGGLIPYDIKLASIRSEKPFGGSLKRQCKISLDVLHGNPDYNNTYTVMATQGNDILINEVFMETADGKYINESKLSALKAILENELQKEEEPPTIAESREFAENIIDKIEREKNKKTGTSRKAKKIIAGVCFGLLACIGIAGVIKTIKKP